MHVHDLLSRQHSALQAIDVLREAADKPTMHMEEAKKFVSGSRLSLQIRHELIEDAHSC